MHRLHEVKQGKGLRQIEQTLGVLFHRLEVTPGLSGGNDGGGLGVPPGYAEFVTAAVRSAMEPFLQNMAQVVGELRSPLLTRELSSWLQ